MRARVATTRLILVMALTLLPVDALLGYFAPKGEEKPAPAWKVEKFTFPAEKHTVKAIIPHGDTALMIVDDDETGFHSVWHADGKSLEPVKFADGQPVRSHFIWPELEGSHAVFRVTNFDTDTTTTVLVIEGKAQTLVDPKGKPVSESYYIRWEGGVLFASGSPETTDDEDDLFVLRENVLHPLTWPDGKQVTAQLSMIDPQPDGRHVLRRASVVGDDEFEVHERCWLDGSKVTLVGRINSPADWGEDEPHLDPLYFKEFTLVVGSGPEAAFAWNVRGDKVEWIVDAEGKRLKHEVMHAGFLGDDVWLFGADDLNHEERSSTGHVYRLEGNKAVELKVPEGKRLGSPISEFELGMPLVYCEADTGRAELWLIIGDTIAPLTTAAGTHVAATYPLEAWNVAGARWIKYTTHEGYFCGRLDSTVLRGPGDGAPVRVYEEGCEWFEVDGDSFLCGALAFSIIVARVEGNALQRIKDGEDNELAGVQVKAAKAGNALYVTTTSVQDESTCWVIRR